MAFVENQRPFSVEFQVPNAPIWGTRQLASPYQQAKGKPTTEAVGLPCDERVANYAAAVIFVMNWSSVMPAAFAFAVISLVNADCSALRFA